MRVGLLGLGAINTTVAKALLHVDFEAGIGEATLCAVLCQNPDKHRATKGDWLPQGLLVTTSIDEFLAASCDVVVEAAGQPTVSEYGEAILLTGAHFLITSTGAMANAELAAKLQASAATAGAGRLLLASGAMAGLDWMQSACISGAREAHVVQRKPPGSWASAAPLGLEKVMEVGEPGSAAWDKHGPLTVFTGTAREAATTFPKSSNVTATLALATVGLDKTHVTLVADPRPDGCFSTTVQLEAECGKITVEVEHAPSADNPRTSADVAFSVIKSLRSICAPVYVGA